MKQHKTGTSKTVPSTWEPNGARRGGGWVGVSRWLCLQQLGVTEKKGNWALTQVRKMLTWAPNRSPSRELASRLRNNNKEATWGCLPCRHLCYDLRTGFEDSSEELNNWFWNICVLEHEMEPVKLFMYLPLLHNNMELILNSRNNKKNPETTPLE